MKLGIFIIVLVVLGLIGLCIYFKVNPLELIGDIIEGFLD